MSKLETVSRVLRLKDFAKEDLEAEVRKVRRMIDSEQELLDSLQKNLAETAELYERRHCESVSAEELRLFSDYFARLYDRMDIQKREILKRLAELHDVQQALVEAYKEKKLMELLKGKIVREEKEHAEKAAQKEMDFQHLSRRHRH